MNFTDIKQLLADEDAVSPVIGVILMVAITVILAAVIGTFVLGLGDQVQSSAPNANFQFEYDTTAGTVDITHNGGQDIDSDNIEVRAEGGSSETGTQLWGGGTQTTISTGDTATFTHGASSGNTVRVIWTSDSGGSSNTIGQSTIPN